MQNTVGYGRRFMYHVTNGGKAAMQEVKHKAWFDSGAVAQNTADNNTITLDAPGAGKSNYLVGAIFHHVQAGMSYRVDHGLSKDLTEAGNIQTEAVKEESDTMMNALQGVTGTGCDSDGYGFGAKGIKLPDDDIRYLYAQGSAGQESVLHGVDIYYIQDTT
jgi:hypothetical protein